MKIAFTGHRRVLHGIALQQALNKLALQLGDGDHIIHTGGAVGFDTLAMSALRHVGSHVLHIPFTYQAMPLLRQPGELPIKWGMCTNCGPVTYNGDKARFQRRNEHMVDQSDVLYAYYLDIPGGTRNCIEYARRVGRQTIDILSGEILVEGQS